jgi:hypothetical protein
MPSQSIELGWFMENLERDMGHSTLNPPVLRRVRNLEFYQHDKWWSGSGLSSPFELSIVMVRYLDLSLFHYDDILMLQIMCLLFDRVSISFVQLPYLSAYLQSSWLM